MGDVINYGALDWYTDLLEEATLYVGWGTGAAAAARASTTLSTETGSRGSMTKAAEITKLTVAQTNDTLKMVKTLTAVGTVTITNAGVFTASSGGTLITSSSFTGVDLTVGNTIRFTFKIQFT